MHSRGLHQKQETNFCAVDRSLSHNNNCFMAAMDLQMVTKYQATYDFLLISELNGDVQAFQKI
jgi:hypothetical protein